MIERLIEQVNELQHQLLVETASGRDSYFGPGFQSALRAIAKSWLSGDWYRVADAVRRNREVDCQDGELPGGFVRMQLLTGGELSVAVNAVAAVRDIVDQRTGKSTGAIVYVTGVSHGAQVSCAGAEVLALVARAQRKTPTRERCELFTVEGGSGALIKAESSGMIGASIPPGVWRVVLERVDAGYNASRCRICSHCGKLVGLGPESTEDKPVWECKSCNAYWTWIAPPPMGDAPEKGV